MITRKILISWIGFITMISSNLYGQSISVPEVLLPTPEVIGLNRGAGFEVGHYTGTASVSIPVYTITEKNLSFPITLNYTGSGGIMVNEEASWVGLGWTLSCTGSISRQIRDKDDLQYHWFGSAKRIPDDPLVNSQSRTNCLGGAYEQTFDESPPYLHLVYDNKVCGVGSGVVDRLDLKINGQRSTYTPNQDYSSDIYSISVPGFNGQFIFDSENNPRFLKPDGHKIEWFKENGIIFWRLITPGGVQYIFKNRVYSRSVNFTDSDVSPWAITAWNLTRIISPQKDSIIFSYTNDGTLSELIRSTPSLSEKFGAANKCGSPSDADIPRLIEPETSKIYLQEISFKNGKLSFETDSRDDLLNGERLRNIKLYEKTSSENYVHKQTFRFGTDSYFISSDSPFSYENRLTSDHKDRENKRLKLEWYDQVNINENLILNNHSFTYNNIDLPVKSSFSVDHWGYFNGANNQTFIPTTPSMNFTGADREPDLAKVTAGMLKTISLPTGGSITFDFKGAGTNFPGVVIERISEYESQTSTAKIKRYEYTGGTASITPYYKSKIWRFWPTCESENLGVESPFYLTSETVVPTGLASGGKRTGYSFVEEFLGENGEYGKVTYKYKNAFIYPRSLSWINPNMTPAAYESRQFQDFEAEYYYKRTNGLLDKKIELAYDGTNHYQVNSTEYIYETHQNLVWQGFTFYRSIAMREADLSLYWYGIPIVWNKLISTIDKSYQTSGAEGVTKTSSFTYETTPKHYQVLKQSRNGSSGKTIESRFKYPDDYSSPALSIQKLKEKNMIIPIEHTKWVDNKLFAGIATKYNYNSGSDLGLPHKVYQLETSSGLTSIADCHDGENFDSNFKLRLMYDSYDDSGNPLSLSKDGGPKISYIWSIDDTYPVIKGTNIDHTTLESAVTSAMSSVPDYSDFEVFMNALVGKMHGGVGNMRSEWNDFNTALRSNTSLAGAQITTYTYDPLIGMTSQTDPAGITTYYEYDDFGRLEYLKDEQGNVLKHYQYHYAE